MLLSLREMAELKEDGEVLEAPPRRLGRAGRVNPISRGVRSSIYKALKGGF